MKTRFGEERLEMELFKVFHIDGAPFDHLPLGEILVKLLEVVIRMDICMGRSDAAQNREAGGMMEI